GLVSARAASSPSASMSRAPREAMNSTRAASWAGQCSALGQRRSTSDSLAGASGAPQEGHSVGMTNSRSVPSRRSTTGATISGMLTLSVSVVDSTRSEDEPVALCYYDGDFHEVPGRDVTRIGVLVHEDGTTRLVLRGDAERLGL